nr:Mur ligase family protein [uncultured Methanobrevibacter sp.]
MVSRIRVNFAKLSGKVVTQLSKIGPGAGKNIPGYVFAKVGGQGAVADIANDLKLGSVLVTGTNGKTTTTTLLIKLISKDIQIRRSFENNTVHSIITAILNQKGDLGIFEYGIRNLEYGIPDTVQKLINPIGVVYTTISKEHASVAGVKNPFPAYYRAKVLLSKDMDHGVIVTNCDDPRTALIGINKQKDIPVNFYGLGIGDIVDDDSNSIKCPNCGKELSYSMKFLNHRGIYSCDCGFKRPEPNVKLTNIELNKDNWKLNIVGDAYNYMASKNIQFEVNLTVPPFGIHNIYNTLASITAYVTFTPKTENIVNNIQNLFNNLDMSFIPPGRFEVIQHGSKFIGIGQGDNGDAVKINSRFMNQYVDGPLEFIYTTPDVDEDEIFNDHFDVIKQMNPEHVIIVPGRHSVKKAEEYYEIIKKEFDSAEFYPLPYEKLDARIEKLTQLAKDSKYNYIIMTGCGEEQSMWEEIKMNFKK